VDAEQSCAAFSSRIAYQLEARLPKVRTNFVVCPLRRPGSLDGQDSVNLQSCAREKLHIIAVRFEDKYAFHAASRARYVACRRIYPACTNSSEFAC